LSGKVKKRNWASGNTNLRQNSSQFLLHLLVVLRGELLAQEFGNFLHKRYGTSPGLGDFERKKKKKRSNILIGNGVGGVLHELLHLVDIHELVKVIKDLISLLESLKDGGLHLGVLNGVDLKTQEGNPHLGGHPLQSKEKMAR